MSSKAYLLPVIMLTCLMSLCRCTQTHMDNCTAGHGFRLACQRSQSDGVSREGLGLRGDQCFVIWGGVYFFSAQVLFPSSPPHRPDRYPASTKVWEKAYEHVSQSALTELKAIEFEISQAAVSHLFSHFSDFL